MLIQKYIDYQVFTFLTLATERNPFRVSGILTNVKMLMQKHIDFQTLTFLTLNTERNPFRVSGIFDNDKIDDVPFERLPCALVKRH